ncbi:MAG TPA: chemotaxis-specific protein-glutamate methyltransferase CheB [Opitutaceae bacterium]|nr:chemotaxis-specific protein-glutamate methyltransferase CheB [Opitutaceae bacterium]
MVPRIRTLIIDDSAFARKVVREILAGNEAIEVVGAARDGEEGLQLAAELSPDVVVCDLRMPKMDGVSFVRRQMAAKALPILILSAAAQDAAEVFDALSAGAIDVVQKPNALATDDLRGIRGELVEKVKEAISAPVSLLEPRRSAPAPLAAVDHPIQTAILVLGISTGGPQALRRLMPLFPGDFPVPIAFVLHMPLGYTSLYAEKLNEICQIEVKEAEEGDRLRPGLALLAQAGRHLSFRRMPNGDVLAQLSVQPLDKHHRPSVDVLFRSAAEVYRQRVLAVVMTGMGDDGREGAAWVKAQGGSVITEDPSSCVIYGMPRSVVEAGLSDASIPLDGMAQAILSRL